MSAHTLHRPAGNEEKYFPERLPAPLAGVYNATPVSFLSPNGF